MTLIELLVGLSVGIIVLSGLSAVYLLTVRGAAENLRIVRLSQELRAVFELMQMDLRRAGYWAAPAGADPTENPFQQRIGGILNDLATGQVQGEPSQSCVTYSYDLNDDGLIGLCRDCTPGGAPFDAPPYGRGNVEMFGFRLRHGTVQMRERLSSPNELAFDCQSGHWQGITSDLVQVTALSFQIHERAINLNPERDTADPCSVGDRCQRVRTVTLGITGQLARDASVQQTLSSQVAIRNDREQIE